MPANPFAPFDLGQVLGQAEAIKSARSNRAMDELQSKYLQQRVGLAEQEQTQQTQAEQNRADAEYAANIFGAVAQSPNKRDAAQRLVVSNPRFQEISQRLQLGDFSRIDDMSDEQIAAGALDNFRALGGLLPQDPSQEVAARHGAVLKEIEARTAAERQLQQQQHGFELEQIGARQQAGGYRPATPEEKQARGVAVDVPAEISPEGQLRPIQVPTAPPALAKAPNELAWNMYQEARAGLTEALGESSTGPIVGKAPAFTAAQQTAEGSVSAMAPVLKQIFRVAGEGTFTDKDQELLLKMVPTRIDRPEARRAKLENIDRIIRAKLGIGQGVSSTAPPSTGGASGGWQIEVVED